MNEAHRPVLLAEALSIIAPRSGGLYVDGTLGAGGHAEAILEASSPDGLLLGLDRDPGALVLAQQRLSRFGQRFITAEDTFDCIGSQLAAIGKNTADGILLDLGVSSMQLDQAARGFSFMRGGPLDMRMGDSQTNAADMVATLSVGEMADLFRRLGEEPLAGRYAEAIAEARRKKDITTTDQLAEIIEAATPAARRRTARTHPATRVFQALRISVNDELGQLDRFLEQVPAWLGPRGVLAIISYHSLEDRRVKAALRRYDAPCTCPPELPVCACGKKPIFNIGRKKPVMATEEETKQNPRARSARLRTAIRTEEPF